VGGSCRSGPCPDIVVQRFIAGVDNTFCPKSRFRPAATVNAAGRETSCTAGSSNCCWLVKE
jgi:hypothetical protein